MSLPAFDGSEYRRTVLTPLRAAAPAQVDDVFWLGHVPRDLDAPAAIAARLRETKAFLYKERSRPRQADVAAAVLAEWPRIEGTLNDPAARRALRTRLGAAAGQLRPDPAPPSARARGLADPAMRRRGQVHVALTELARLRADPDLAEDLFAFLGLPLTATKPMIGARMEQAAGVNRRRRADRERSLVDELLMHARELLVEGDPAEYRAGLAADANADQRPPTIPTPPAAVASPTSEGATPVPTGPPAPVAPPVESIGAGRDARTGEAVITWSWPEGVTEVFVAVGAAAHPSAPGPGGRKITNTKYAIEDGARIAPTDAPPGTTVRVFSGRRDASGGLAWNDEAHARETIAP